MLSGHYKTDKIIFLRGWIECHYPENGLASMLIE